MYTKNSKRWIIPNYRYTETWKVPKTSYTLQLLMIYTVTLSGISYDHEYCDKYNIEDCIIHPSGPDDEKLSESQYQWIEDTLAASKDDYIIVAGHYPIYSIAEHGSTASLVKNLMP
eukprot:305777_1